MSGLAWFCAGFGTATGLIILLAVVVDLVFIEWHEETISRRSLLASVRRPAVAALVSGVLCLLLGMLLGHLFLGQVIVAAP